MKKTMDFLAPIYRGSACYSWILYLVYKKSEKLITNLARYRWEVDNRVFSIIKVYIKSRFFKKEPLKYSGSTLNSLWRKNFLAIVFYELKNIFQVFIKQKRARDKQWLFPKTKINRYEEIFLDEFQYQETQ